MRFVKKTERPQKTLSRFTPGRCSKFGAAGITKCARWQMYPDSLHSTIS
jgi:hypothetical protein